MTSSDLTRASVLDGLFAPLWAGPSWVKVLQRMTHLETLVDPSETAEAKPASGSKRRPQAPSDVTHVEV